MRITSRAALALLVLGFGTSAHATLIEFDITNVSPSQWRYDYYITNDSLESPIEEFTIWFDRNLYGILDTPMGPAGWDSIVAQPDFNLPDDGFYDSLALGGGVGVGESLSGFSVMFTWLGEAIPSLQSFQIVDPVTFETIDSGSTQLRAASPPTSVPEPSSLGLMACAIGVLALFRNRRRVHASL